MRRSGDKAFPEKNNIEKNEEAESVVRKKWDNLKSYK